MSESPVPPQVSDEQRLRAELTDVRQMVVDLRESLQAATLKMLPGDLRDLANLRDLVRRERQLEDEIDAILFSRSDENLMSTGNELLPCPKCGRLMRPEGQEWFCTRACEYLKARDRLLEKQVAVSTEEGLVRSNPKPLAPLPPPKPSTTRDRIRKVSCGMGGLSQGSV